VTCPQLHLPLVGRSIRRSCEQRRRIGGFFISAFAARIRNVCGALVTAPQLHAQTYQERLPRAAFDVIWPSERVTGQRGAISRSKSFAVSVPQIGRAAASSISPCRECGRSSDADHRRDQDRRSRAAPWPRSRCANPKLAQLNERNSRASARPAREMDATIAGYWSATPDGPRVLPSKISPGEGRRGAVNWVQPWSAAFVSWVMCEAGLGDDSSSVARSRTASTSIRRSRATARD
jgi:hypothetical protein